MTTSKGSREKKRENKNQKHGSISERIFFGDVVACGLIAKKEKTSSHFFLIYFLPLFGVIVLS